MSDLDPRVDPDEIARAVERRAGERRPFPFEARHEAKRIEEKVGHDLGRTDVLVRYTLDSIAHGTPAEDALCRLVAVLAHRNAELFDAVVAAAERAPFPFSVEVKKPAAAGEAAKL